MRRDLWRATLWCDFSCRLMITNGAVQAGNKRGFEPIQMKERGDGKCAMDRIIIAVLGVRRRRRRRLYGRTQEVAVTAL